MADILEEAFQVQEDNTLRRAVYASEDDKGVRVGV
jgi:hypothetical protein